MIAHVVPLLNHDHQVADRPKVSFTHAHLGGQQVIRTMGRPILEFPDSLVFHIEDRGYPIQARLYFDEGGLADVYCFRGDL